MKSRKTLSCLLTISMLTSSAPYCFSGNTPKQTASGAQKFDPNNSVSWRFFSRFFGNSNYKIPRALLLDIANEVVALCPDLRLSREACRRKKALIKWFDTNWFYILPCLHSIDLPKMLCEKLLCYTVPKQMQARTTALLEELGIGPSSNEFKKLMRKVNRLLKASEVNVPPLDDAKLQSTNYLMYYINRYCVQLQPYMRQAAAQLAEEQATAPPSNQTFPAPLAQTSAPETAPPQQHSPAAHQFPLLPFAQDESANAAFWSLVSGT